jgi:hypothetical protein
MVGRMTDKYPVEKRELAALFVNPGTKQRELDEWVDQTLDMHRAQADAVARMDAYQGSWWDRNWFGVALIAFLAVGMVVIGLVNGWS